MSFRFNSIPLLSKPSSPLEPGAAFGAVVCGVHSKGFSTWFIAEGAASGCPASCVGNLVSTGGVVTGASKTGAEGIVGGAEGATDVGIVELRYCVASKGGS